MLPLFVLVGPTAIGKTSLSIKLAKELKGEIVSADSMQVYRNLDIGTAKVTKNEMEDIPHYLIDIIDPTENFSVADFQSLAKEKIAEIASREVLPMLVGGTGLYVNSIVSEYNFTDIGDTEDIRRDLWKIAEDKGNEELIEKLKVLDPISAEKIHPNDSKRIIRALEVYYASGKPISSYQNNTSNYDLNFIGLHMDREKLYERINLRVDLMLEAGWLDELKNLLASGVPANVQALQGLGYKQLLMHLNGDISYEKAIELIKRETRRFAKRQITWFKRDERIKWINVDDKNEAQILAEILSYIEK
ncbi:tRNA (adenosine(37)-N6)-dimethylallyltransferase MiaA [Desulfonispora thiosulfatigenes]|uniref:tRNA (adenosine(37)-N6)-dimethylallyltransferase MiaA n=1 Tax=Desulfonispora thiosulfatigenes TaxID=83661 RepID=UPI0009FDBB07|nr:tRNA (adenosine(37)-N6)-dimethylallyltransferase MiaA [Desulfonispora thiosulfatigenes]